MPYLEVPPDLRMFYQIDDWTDPWTHPETIVLIHGFGESTEAWRGWVPHLSRYYRVIRIDQRGFGQSGPVPEGFTFTTELFVDDLVGVINRLAGEPVHLVGAKSGGMGVIKLAATRPDLVKTITVTSTPVGPSQVQGQLEHMEKLGMRNWARTTMPGRLGSTMPLRGLDWWVDMTAGTAMSTARAYMRWVRTVDLTGDLEKIKCPTLVITTASSRHVRTELETSYKGHIQNLETEVIPVDGFHAAGSDPDACARRTLDFLARYRQRTH